MTVSILKVQGLTTQFTTDDGTFNAVDNVSFEIAAGGTVGLVGESGCGKTVTALSILRLIDPPGRITNGKVLLRERVLPPAHPRWCSPASPAGLCAIGGPPTGVTRSLNDTPHYPMPVDLLKLPEGEIRKVRGGRIAMIFQEPMTSLNPVFTIENQMDETLRLHSGEIPPSPPFEKGGARGARGGFKKQILEWLDRVKIADPARVAKSYPHELSGGMRQRVMIAMALSRQPDLLIADEPTTALDVTIQAQVMKLLAELQRELGMALFLITHDLGLIAETVDEAIIMYAGTIVERASVHDLFRSPRHPYTEALLKSIPRINSKERLATLPGSVPNLADLPPGCRFSNRCRKVVEKCRGDEPILDESRPGSSVRCYFPGGTST